MSYKKIIDVSYHNGSINWSKVKAAGIKGVIIRAGYGAGNVDKLFKSNIKGALAAGLPVGIYWFSYAYNTTMAKKEADYCYKLIKDYKITLPVIFDWEYDSDKYARKHGVKVGKTLFTAMNKGFGNIMKAKGYKVGFYYNKDYMNRGLFDFDDFKGYYRWLARYTSVTQTNCDIWQYSETGRVSGINSSQVDMNYVINEKVFGTEKVEKPSKPTTPTTTKYTQTDFVKDCQRIFGLSVTGKPNQALLNKTITVSSKTNRTHRIVKYIQKYLKTLGYPIGTIDGEAGSKFTKSVKSFQKKVLKFSSPDGVISAKNKTWKKLLGL